MNVLQKIQKVLENPIWAHLERFTQTGERTIGWITMFNANQKRLGDLSSMELPWKDNQRMVSCVLPGLYIAIRHTSPSKGDVYKVYTLEGKEVPGRSEILIHVGNYVKNTQGCILPGSGITDINQDGIHDVAYSRNALDRMKRIAPDGFLLMIS